MTTNRDDNFDKAALIRLGSWGGGAAVALVVAVVAMQSDIGARRLATAYSGTAAAATARSATNQLAPDPVEDTRRLSDAVRSLSTDRDRLLARITVLERNLDDVTGSIGRIGDDARRTEIPSASPLPKESSIATATGPTFAGTVAALPVQSPAPGITTFSARVSGAHAAATGDAPATESITTTTEFGIDLGGGSSMDAMRDLWAAAKSNHGAALQGLQPRINVRDGAKPGVFELRLIAGPLANAGAAAKLCGALAAGGWSCRPAVFDGQRLALQ